MGRLAYRSRYKKQCDKVDGQKSWATGCLRFANLKRDMGMDVNPPEHNINMMKGGTVVRSCAPQYNNSFIFDREVSALLKLWL